MNIGIDIDDTITDLSQVFLKYAILYNKENKIKFEIDKTQWNLDKAFGWNENDYSDFSKKYLEKLLNEAKPKKNVVSIINRLRDEGNKITFITARNSEELKNPYIMTKKWLDNNNISYDKLIVNSIKKEKDCLENQIDIFIDDRLENCEKIQSELNIPVFLFESVYNANENNPMIEKVSDWSELYKKINKIKIMEEL